MKKIFVILDVIMMLVTIVIFLYIELKPTYGLASLAAIAKGFICIIALGVEALILVSIFIVKKVQDKKHDEHES